MPIVFTVDADQLPTEDDFGAITEGPVYGDDGLLAGPRKLVILAGYVHVYWATPKAIASVVRVNQQALAESTERDFATVLSPPDLIADTAGCRSSRFGFA